MTAIIAALVPLIPSLVALGQQGIQFIATLRAAGQQSGEWSQAAEEAFIASVFKSAVDPAWQPDKP